MAKFGFLDPEYARDDLREYAQSQGIDFDELLEQAGRHFQSSEIVRRITPLTPEELDALFEDDEDALRR
jgi:hypothetical protein